MRFTRFFIAAAAGVACLPLGAAHAQDGRQRVDTTFAFERGGSVTLGIVSGEIRVTAGSANEIRIVASIERGRFETAFSRSRVSVVARSVNGRMGETRIEVTAPVGTRVRANSVSGDITVRGTRGEVEVATVSGDVTVSEGATVIQAGTVSGTLDLSQLTGRLEASSVSGSVRVADVSGDVSVGSVSGRVTIREARVRTLRASSVSGDISYDGVFDREGSYRFNSHSGSVHFSLPADAAATLELETFSGRISSDFAVTLQPGETVGQRNRRMQFSIGGGSGVRISAETFSGNITIRRAAPRGTEE